MRILIATDAWHPQVNGVVLTYDRLSAELDRLGVETFFLTPQDFATFPCPTYAEIRLAMPWPSIAAHRIKELAPSVVHIATEGPVGWMMRLACRRAHLPFTTSFHTRFPDYVEHRTGVPAAWTWSMLRRFHNAGAGTMVATPSLARELTERGFLHIVPWTRGIDTERFRPRPVRLFGTDTVFLYVGRVAVEKNLEAFLLLNLPGLKVVVGDGPARSALAARFPDVVFTGQRTGDDLAECYASADVFVFPSRTDTFGNVILEAMASGLPIAAFPVTGPIDLVSPGQSGVLSEDLAAAVRGALALDRSKVRAHAMGYSWQTTARMFLSNLEAARRDTEARRVPADELPSATRHPV